MRENSILDVSGLRVGHAHDDVALTGCTVVLILSQANGANGAIAGVDVRGGAPGTRETDLLDPANTVDTIHGLCLAGGSAFGLDAATGVVRYLHEQGIGYEVGTLRIPIVPAAIIFDLGVGHSDVWPDAAMGYAAAHNAMTGDELAEGNVGGGAGASVGKITGMAGAMKSGVGTAARPFGSYQVGALVVTNAFGDVVDRHGSIIAGARDPQTGAFVDTVRVLSAYPPAKAAPTGGNTTIAAIATDMPLSKSDCSRVARMAHDAFARAIRPVHTPLDGDTIFVLSTGGRPSTPVDPILLAAMGTVAVETLIDAIERSVRKATSAGGLPGLAGER